MAKKTIKLPSLSRVVAGSTATLEMPIGPTYKRIFFQLTGTGLDVTDIGRISVLMNGKVKQTFKNLQRLFDLNAFYNRGADAVTDFVLHFERAEMHDLVYRRAPGIGTADLQTMHLEIELVAAAPADITMKAWAEVDPMPQPAGVFFNIREYPTNAAAAGLLEFDKLPRGGWYAGIHLAKADISAVEIQANQVKIVDATKAVLHRAAKEGSPVKRVPVAGYTHIDMLLDGDMAQAIKTANLQDFRINMTCDTAGAFDIVAETLDGMN